MSNIDEWFAAYTTGRPEPSWQGQEPLVLRSAPPGCGWRNTRPAGNALQLDRNSDARRRREMSPVTRQAVGDVDHGARSPACQPTSRGNPRHRPGEAAP